jgi:uncharacterized protein
MSLIRQAITEHMKEALKASQKERLSAVRLIFNAIKQREIDERKSLTDEDILAILSKMAKQRQESIALYQTAKRQDLVDKETAELAIIQSYLPKQLGDDELEQIIKATMTELNVTSVRDMGKVMSALKPQLQGRADMAVVGGKIKHLLSD